MKFSLDDIKRMDTSLKETGDKFLDRRVREMRNPEGFVAAYYGFPVTIARGLCGDLP